MDFNVKIYLEAIKVAVLANCPDEMDDIFSGEKINVSIIPAIELSKRYHYTDNRSFWHSDYGDEKYKWLYWTNKRDSRESLLSHERAMRNKIGGREQRINFFHSLFPSFIT